MSDKTRMKDANWKCGDGVGNSLSMDHAILAVLMDLRDELKAANTKLSILNCPNFINIPNQLAHMTKAAKRANLNAQRRRKAERAK